MSTRRIYGRPEIFHPTRVLSAAQGLFWYRRVTVCLLVLFTIRNSVSGADEIWFRVRLRQFVSPSLFFTMTDAPMGHVAASRHVPAQAASWVAAAGSRSTRHRHKCSTITRASASWLAAAGSRSTRSRSAPSWPRRSPGGRPTNSPAIW